MKFARVLVVVAAVGSLIAAGVVARAVVRDDPPVLRSIEFSRRAITVQGLEAKPLTVSVHLSDPDGVAASSVRIGEFPPVRLTLSSGTPQDGVWAGGFAVTSEWSGDYRPALLEAADQSGDKLSVRDPDAPAVAVSSYGRPLLRLSASPDPAVPGDAVTQRVVMTDRDTGEPLRDTPFVIADDAACSGDLPRTPNARTNSSGVYTRTLPAGVIQDWVSCAWATADGQPATRIAQVSARLTYRFAITAAAQSTSVKARTDVAVNGTLQPRAQGKEVELQRLYPGNEWRTVNRGVTDGESRIRLLATPPGTGTYSYRLFAPAQTNRAAAFSEVFTIRGT